MSREINFGYSCGLTPIYKAIYECAQAAVDASLADAIAEVHAAAEKAAQDYTVTDAKAVAADQKADAAIAAAAAADQKADAAMDKVPTSFTIENGRYVVTLADGSKINGPFVPAGTLDEAPTLSGGSLTFVDGDLILTPPTASGDPAPTVTLTSLTRDGTDVTGELTANRIVGAAVGNYEAVWTASNGVNPDAVITRTLAVGTAPTVTSVPTISVDDNDPDVLVRTAGTATGDPAPALESIEWAVDDEVIPDYNDAQTFDRRGFPAGAIVTTRDVWTNSIGSATGESAGYTLPAETQYAPVAPTIGAQGLEIGEPYSRDIVFSDPNGGNLTITTSGTLPAGLTYDPITNGVRVTGTPTTSETTFFDVMASKPGFPEVSVSVEYTVSSPAGTALIYDPDVTVSIAEDTFTITAPDRYAGQYTVTDAETAGGPVPIVAPRISGNPVPDAELSVILDGLWVGDVNANPLTVTGQWEGNGVPIAGATGKSYVVAPVDQGKTITYVETGTDGNGTRTSASAGITISGLGDQRDTFSAPVGTPLKDYVGESGYSWDDPEGNRCAIGTGNILESATSSKSFLQRRTDPVAADQFAEARMIMRTGSGNHGLGLAVRINGKQSGYCTYHNGARWYLVRLIDGAVTDLGSYNITYADGQETEVRLEVQGTTLRLLLDGVEVKTGSDATFATGSIGIRAFSAGAPYMTDFGGGSL